MKRIKFPIILLTITILLSSLSNCSLLSNATNPLVINTPTWQIGNFWHYYYHYSYSSPDGSYSMQETYDCRVDVIGERNYTFNNNTYEVFIINSAIDIAQGDGDGGGGSSRTYVSNYTEYVIKNNYSTIWEYEIAKFDNSVYAGPSYSHIWNYTSSEYRFLNPDNRYDFPLQMGKSWYNNYSYQCNTTYNSGDGSGINNFTGHVSYLNTCENEEFISSYNSIRVVTEMIGKGSSTDDNWISDVAGNWIRCTIDCYAFSVTINIHDGRYNNTNLSPVTVPEFLSQSISIVFFITILYIIRKQKRIRKNTNE